MEPERKSDRVRRLIREGDYKAAFRIAKDFRLGISKEQSDNMIRGYECMTNPRFYVSIGVDIARTVEKGLETLLSLYGV